MWRVVDDSPWIASKDFQCDWVDLSCVDLHFWIHFSMNRTTNILRNFSGNLLIFSIFSRLKSFKVKREIDNVQLKIFSSV